MPYEKISELPNSVQKICPNMPRKSTKRSITMPGMNIQVRKSATVMSQEKKQPTK